MDQEKNKRDRVTAILLNRKIQTAVKRARLFAAMWECRHRYIRRPVVAYLLITDRCNMKCRYCFVECNNLRREATVSEWIAVVDRLVEEGCRMVCLMGGEPLLRGGIDVLVDHITSKGILCDVTTNGILVKEKIDVLRKVDSVMVSMDGVQMVHNVNRQNWLAASGAIGRLKEEGIPVRINAVMTKQNVDEKNIDFLLDWDVPVTFALAAEFPRKYKDLEKDILLDDEQVKGLYRMLRRKKAEGKPVLFSYEALDYMINYPHPFRGIPLVGEYYRQRCPFGQQMVYIDANGDMYPCAALWNSYHFHPLNLSEHGFERAWNNMDWNRMPCTYCFCVGVPEWNRMTSFRGLWDGVRLTLKGGK